MENNLGQNRNIRLSDTMKVVGEGGMDEEVEGQDIFRSQREPTREFPWGKLILIDFHLIFILSFSFNNFNYVRRRRLAFHRFHNLHGSMVCFFLWADLRKL